MEKGIAELEETLCFLETLYANRDSSVIDLQAEINALKSEIYDRLKADGTIPSHF